MRRWVKISVFTIIVLISVIGVVAFTLSEKSIVKNNYTSNKTLENSNIKSSSDTRQVYTCAMHPQVRLYDPDAKCPICGMSLIPVKNDFSKEINHAEHTGTQPSNIAQTQPSGTMPSTQPSTTQPIYERRITLSSQAVALLDIEVTPVIRAPATLELNLVGKIDYDETRLTYTTAWFGGRLDRLFVDYTGTPIRKGDHLALIYSPEVYTAQEELIQAVKSQKNIPKTASSQVKRINQLLLAAARDKLRLWGLTEEQIIAIEERGKPSEHVTLYATVSGVVIDKNANQGSYVETGTRIYTIADLSIVWLNLSAYESDLVWLRYGQKVDFTVQAFPGVNFHGTIAFISPVLSEASRTVQVRVNVKNKDEMLKPGMLARATIKAMTVGEGKVIEPNLMNQYICPMHPEEISSMPGQCTICGMDLIEAERLGYASSDEMKSELPLLIPRTAVLLTGRRAVVYVRILGQVVPTFEGRVIELGPRVGEQYIVESGLEEGELVVSSGNFSIDSALQIQAKPSMMSPEGGAAPVHHHGGMNMDMDMGYEEMNAHTQPSTMPAMEDHSIHHMMKIDQDDQIKSGKIIKSIKKNKSTDKINDININNAYALLYLIKAIMHEREIESSWLWRAERYCLGLGRFVFSNGSPFINQTLKYTKFLDQNRMDLEKDLAVTENEDASEPNASSDSILEEKFSQTEESAD